MYLLGPATSYIILPTPDNISWLRACRAIYICCWSLRTFRSWWTAHFSATPAEWLQQPDVALAETVACNISLCPHCLFAISILKAIHNATTVLTAFFMWSGVELSWFYLAIIDIQLEKTQISARTPGHWRNRKVVESMPLNS